MGGERNENVHRFDGETAQRYFHSVTLNRGENERHVGLGTDLPNAGSAMAVGGKRATLVVVMHVAREQRNRRIKQTDCERDCPCFHPASGNFGASAPESQFGTPSFRGARFHEWLSHGCDSRVQWVAVALLLLLSGCMQRLIRFKSAVLIACIATASVITPIDAHAGIGDFFHNLFHRKQPGQTQKQSRHQTPQKSKKKQPAKLKKYKFQEHGGY